MPLNRLIENSGGYAGFADNCHTPVNEKPLQTPRGLQGLFSILKRIRKFYVENIVFFFRFGKLYPENLSAMPILTDECL